MRISLWQQFSSNHSARFTVVGTFDSPAKANEAAAELQRILARIETWWGELSPEEWNKWRDKTETSELTPPEHEFSQHYKVDWPFTINWYTWASWHHENSPVTVFEKFVFVESPHYYIWHGPQPFEELMIRFGANVALESDESQSHTDETLLLNVRCTLPSDAETAILLYESFNEDFAFHRDSPWDDSYHPNIDYPFNYDLVIAKFPVGVRVYEVERQDDYLYLYGIDIMDVYSIPESDRLAKILPKLADFLRKEGCTDIQFSFRSSPRLSHKGEA
jgi:hypothetical protein